MISVRHAIPRDDVSLGIVRADGVDMAQYPDGFDDRLSTLLARRQSQLTQDEESRRQASRDILRNGRYKPTGRGKPASEYLIRAASDQTNSFPRINAPVDICNFLSLAHIVPISLWDHDFAATDTYVFRFGLSWERFVFNEGGQFVELEDLLVGCRVREDDIPPETPIVNPVKDSLLTKTTPSSKRIAACIYAPSMVVSEEDLEAICVEFADQLEQCGSDVDSAFGIVLPGQTLTL